MPDQHQRKPTNAETELGQSWERANYAHAETHLMQLSVVVHKYASSIIQPALVAEPVTENCSDVVSPILPKLCLIVDLHHHLDSGVQLIKTPPATCHCHKSGAAVTCVNCKLVSGMPLTDKLP